MGVSGQVLQLEGSWGISLDVTTHTHNTSHIITGDLHAPDLISVAGEMGAGEVVHHIALDLLVGVVPLQVLEHAQHLDLVVLNVVESNSLQLIVTY